MILGAGCIDWTLVESDIVQKFVAGQKWSYLEKNREKVVTHLWAPRICLEC